MARYTKTEIEQSRAWLLENVKPGDTVYTVLRHVSSSGMSRRIDLVIFRADGLRLYLSRHAACVLGMRFSDKGTGGIVVSGCGMDMGFHLVYNLGYSLWHDGYICPGNGKCQSNSHHNPGPNRDAYGPTVTHTDGYALRHEWI